MLTLGLQTLVILSSATMRFFVFSEISCMDCHEIWYTYLRAQRMNIILSYNPRQSFHLLYFVYDQIPEKPMIFPSAVGYFLFCAN